MSPGIAFCPGCTDTLKGTQGLVEDKKVYFTALTSGQLGSKEVEL